MTICSQSFELSTNERTNKSEINKYIDSWTMSGIIVCKLNCVIKFKARHCNGHGLTGKHLRTAVK